MADHPIFDRRAFIGAGAALAASVGLQPAWAARVSHGRIAARKEGGTLTGEDIRLVVANSQFTVDGRTGHAITVNGSVPAPLIRLKEGQNVRLTVENRLDEDTSIHWHGLLVPFQMDGVPGVSFPGIPPRSSFHLRIPDLAGGHLLVSQPFRDCRSRPAIMARS